MMTISDVTLRSSPRTSRSLSYRKFGKRVFDVLFTLAAAPLILPIIAILAIIIRRDGGPAFFGHTRVGENGKTFKCLKLRTMVVNSQEVLAQHLAANADAQAEWDRDFKLENDPRITKIGNILRKTSLDELPQFWNAFVGDISVVGPRPVTQKEIDRYGMHATEVLSVKPGITGPWQVGGRNDTTYDERIAMDVKYARTLSFTGDVLTIIKTVGVVVLRKGK